MMNHLARLYVNIPGSCACHLLALCEQALYQFYQRRLAEVHCQLGDLPGVKRLFCNEKSGYPGCFRVYRG